MADRKRLDFVTPSRNHLDDWVVAQVVVNRELGLIRERGFKADRGTLGTEGLTEHQDCAASNALAETDVYHVFRRAVNVIRDDHLAVNEHLAQNRRTVQTVVDRPLQGRNRLVVDVRVDRRRQRNQAWIPEMTSTHM